MKYKQGEKMIVEIAEVKENSYVLNKIGEVESLETKIENLKKKLKRWVEKCTNQSAEITRLLAENKELKENFEKSKIVNLNMGRVAGQNEAWKLAQKITKFQLDDGYSIDELKAIFGHTHINEIIDLTYQEAAAKVAEWEKAKEEIKTGDVLENIYDSNVKCIVTNLYPNNRAYLVFDDGTAGINELDNFKKTGRHIDIDSFLKQIRGEQE